MEFGYMYVFNIAACTIYKCYLTSLYRVRESSPHKMVRMRVRAFRSLELLQIDVCNLIGKHKYFSIIYMYEYNVLVFVYWFDVIGIYLYVASSTLCANKAPRFSNICACIEISRIPKWKFNTT